MVYVVARIQLQLIDGFLFKKYIYMYLDRNDLLKRLVSSSVNTWIGLLRNREDY